MIHITLNSGLTSWQHVIHLRNNIAGWGKQNLFLCCSTGYRLVDIFHWLKFGKHKLLTNYCLRQWFWLSLLCIRLQQAGKAGFHQSKTILHGGVCSVVAHALCSYLHTMRKCYFVWQYWTSVILTSLPATFLQGAEISKWLKQSILEWRFPSR
jgi:hypothetical protein